MKSKKLVVALLSVCLLTVFTMQVFADEGTTIDSDSSTLEVSKVLDDSSEVSSGTEDASNLLPDDVTKPKEYDDGIIMPLATIVVTDENSLLAAIASADTDDVLQLTQDIKLTDTIELNKEITIDGDNHTLTAAPGKRHFSVADGAIAGNGHIFKNIVFEGDNDGGGVLLRGVKSAKLTGVTMQNIYTGRFFSDLGGALRINMPATASDIEITDCKFIGNENTAQGGSIVTYNSGGPGGKLTLRNVTIDDSKASHAGAIYLSTNTQLYIYDSFFTNNHATNDADVGTPAAARAGAIEASNYNTVYAEGTVFSGNTAARGGAIVFASKSDLYLTDCTFTDNSAVEYGGAIGSFYYFSGGSSVNVNGGSFENNTSGGAGGAIFVHGYATLNAAPSATGHTVFKNNHAKTDGGAIATDSANLANIELDGVEFTGNTASNGASYPFANDADYADILAIHTANITNTRNLSTSATNLAYNNLDINMSRVSLTYNANDGSGRLHQISFPAGTSVTVDMLANMFGVSGANFLGWSTSASGGTLLAPGSAISLTGSQVYYAQWDSAPVTPTPSSPSTPASTPSSGSGNSASGSTGSTIAKTGDAANTTVFIIIIVVAVVVLVGLAVFMVIKKRKK